MSDAASPIRRLLLRSLAALAGAAAAACGGGGSAGGVGTGGTGDGAGTTPGGGFAEGGATPGSAAQPLPATRNATVVGPVTGFGSVFVGGVRFDVAAAQVASEDQPAWRAEDLRLGMVVQVQGAIGSDGLSGTAFQVRAFGEVRGPITRLDAAAGSLAVVGAPIMVDARTVFDGIAGLSALRLGDYVEAYGLPGQAGAPILATRVSRARSPLDGGGPIKTRGVAVGVDAATRRFSINGLVVSYASAASLAAPLADGTSVIVRADSLLTPGAIVAARIDADLAPAPSEGASTRLEGSVGAFRSAADFKVGGVAVDASAPGVRFDNGSAAGLRNGLKVVVTGTFGSNVLRADTVAIGS